MKRRDILSKIATEAATQGVTWTFRRKGANHDIYSLGGVMVPIPRHREIGERMTEKIFKECVPKLGEGWWK